MLAPNCSTSTTQDMAGLALRSLLPRMLLPPRSAPSMAHRLKKSFPSHCLRRTPIALLSYPSSIMISGRCTRIRWPASGLSTRLISVRTSRTGRTSKRTSSISSSMSLPSSQPQMASYSRTSPSASLQKSKSLRHAASTASRWWWRIFTQRPTQS